MGWDRKVRGPATGYYYTSVRMPDKPYPVKVYLGRGPSGQLAAAKAEERKRQRQQARDAFRDELKTLAEGDRLATELRAWANVLESSWMIITGHHLHRGEWRLTKMTRKPRVGSAAWDRSLCDSPAYVRQLLQSVSARAAGR